MKIFKSENCTSINLSWRSEHDPLRGEFGKNISPLHYHTRATGFSINETGIENSDVPISNIGLDVKGYKLKLDLRQVDIF